ncbi:MAG: DUF5696 domain-containing protein [Acholeplasmataceae bacterium]
MVKWLKYSVILLLFSFSLSLIVYGNTSVVSNDDVEVESNFNYINQTFLESSRFTQKDQVDQEKLDHYHDNFILPYTESDLETIGFEKMFDTDELLVYFEKDSFSMMVFNKKTGYLWSSRPEFQGISGERENNTANRNLMNSGLWVEYVRAANVSSSLISLESLYSLAEVSYQTDGSIKEGQEDAFSPYLIEEGSYNTRNVSVTYANKNNTSFTVVVDLKEIDVKFTVTVSLNNGTLSVSIPSESIEESGDIYRLLSIQVFPNLGAAREDHYPGYFMIPDGIGALVRLDKAHNTRFQSKYYGADMGYRQNTIPMLSVPIFGLVHEHGANGIIAEIEEGAEVSSLVAQFWGSNSRYHRIGAKYDVRDIYRYVINKAGDGNDAIIENFTMSNFRINYQFLSDDDASYVGMAKAYRDILIDRNILSDSEKELNNQIPIHLGYIMSDQEKSFIGSTSIEMTSVEDVLNNYQRLKDQNIVNQQMTLFGWSKDGFVFQSPYRTRIAHKNDYIDLFETIKSDQNTIYLDNDYVMASELTDRLSYNPDVARNLSRLKMESMYRSLNAQVTEIYYLYPDRSYTYAKNDEAFFDSLGISGLYLNSIGNLLYSYYDQVNIERSVSLQYYQDLVNLYDQVLLSTPNAYFYASLSGYLDMPITNAQYDYYSDLVPIIPLILKGSVSYYTPYLNFNAMGEDRLLVMVDFGINPSYILTENDTYEMRYTNASIFYTTTRSDYEDEIVDTYTYLNDALKHVIGIPIENREVIETGFVKVTYANGVIIYVNYNYTSFSTNGLTIPARDYEVVMP